MFTEHGFTALIKLIIICIFVEFVSAITEHFWDLAVAKYMFVGFLGVYLVNFERERLRRHHGVRGEAGRTGR